MLVSGRGRFEPGKDLRDLAAVAQARLAKPVPADTLRIHPSLLVTIWTSVTISRPRLCVREARGVSPA
ncbi:hypothetical protein GCM10009765_69500 [Fodinicola feengrottensis]|uniref:Uncharacterized protein n=1 Tax=Fodinicola feengrottensis TaxID=435914 RepID=A0ABP4UR16_9ACTN